MPTDNPTPQEIARIQANVAKMRAMNAPEADVVAYLQHEDALSAAGPKEDTSISLRNVGRSAVQGATLGWGDEMGLTSKSAEQAFKTQHPIVDFLAKMGGGLAAPAAAVAAAPVLGTTLGGAALLGAGVGAMSGAGEAEDGNRSMGALQGGLLGAGGGVAGYGVAKGAGSILGTIANRMHPERVVAKSAAQLLTPDVAAKLAQVDAIAPGGASLATALVPQTSAKAVPRFLPMLRAVGADANASASAEASLTGQKTALDAARKGLGDKMDAIQKEIPITAEARGVMGKAREILGAKAPAVPDAPESVDLNALGVEKSVPFSFGEAKKTVDVQELRDALSRLRFSERLAAKQGVDANGVALHDIQVARAGLQSFIYKHVPEFEALDKPYAIASGQLRQTDKAIKTVQASRANYTANEAYGSTSGSLGGSLPRGAHGVIMTALDKMLTNKAGAADAVARLIAKPGGSELVQQLLAGIPTPSTAGTRLTTAGASAAIPAMRGLLFPQDQ